jgi:hypothetical protein
MTDTNNNESAAMPNTPETEQPFVTLSEESIAKGTRFPTEEERAALLKKLSSLDDQ